MRIRPLELFPNGLLIEKSADTIVAGSLEVDVIGIWNDEFFVQEESCDRLRPRYEKELEAREAELIRLKEEADTIDPKRRGSHVNKVKAVERRIESIRRGLEDSDVALVSLATPVLETTTKFKVRDIVLLPSGTCGMVTTISSSVASVVLKTKDAQLVRQEVDPAILSPASLHTRATI